MDDCNARRRLVQILTEHKTSPLFFFFFFSSPSWSLTHKPFDFNTISRRVGKKWSKIRSPPPPFFSSLSLPPPFEVRARGSRGRRSNVDQESLITAHSTNSFFFFSLSSPLSLSFSPHIRKRRRTGAREDRVEARIPSRTRRSPPNRFFFLSFSLLFPFLSSRRARDETGLGARKVRLNDFFFLPPFPFLPPYSPPHIGTGRVKTLMGRIERKT